MTMWNYSKGERKRKRFIKKRKEGKERRYTRKQTQKHENKSTARKENGNERSEIVGKTKQWGKGQKEKDG
jgi:hypothetical protein